MNTKTALLQFNKIKSLMGNMRLASENWPNPFQTLISTILSARTLDETTIKVCTKLFKEYPDAQTMSKATLFQIQLLIKSVNFYRNKSKSLINCSKQLVENYNGKVPYNFKELISLPGVGRKTANVFLQNLGYPNIGVDTHVEYISNYLGWTSSNKQEVIEENLKKLFPLEIWNQINPTLVKFGKKYTSRKQKNKILEKIKNFNLDL